MKTVNEHGHKRHLLVLGECGRELSRPDSDQFLLDSVHLLVKRPKYIRVFSLCIGEDESDDLWPQLLLVLNQLVNGGQNLILLLAVGLDRCMRL